MLEVCIGTILIVGVCRGKSDVPTSSLVSVQVS